MAAKSTTYSLDVLPDPVLLTASSVKLFEDSANGANSVGLKAPATLAADYTLTLPIADGTSGQALTTNGSGTLSFASVSTPGAVSVVQYNITTTTASSSTTLPSGAVIISAQLQIVSAYSAGTTITLGYTGNTTGFMATTDNVPGTVGIYSNWVMGVSLPSALPVLATISGSPAAGSATVRIMYSTSPNP
jgi:hypothetical protein